MTKPTAPMMGGQNCPPVEATASTAPANSFRYPVRFIRGMVMVPVVATLAMAEPLIMPMRAEATTATFAGPPGVWPTNVREKSLMNLEKPLCFKNAPNTTKRKMYVADTPIPVPSTPWVPQNWVISTRFRVNPLCPSSPGRNAPNQL